MKGTVYEFLDNLKRYIADNTDYQLLYWFLEVPNTGGDIEIRIRSQGNHICLEWFSSSDKEFEEKILKFVKRHVPG